ncbi:MAG: hypothetical protein ABSB12_01900 [Candidatus Saccharimonadales bacterium]|jgi:hypothetical protein
MSTKSLIWISITIFSTLGSWLGDILGHGWLSAWSLILGVVGCFFGIWAGWWFGKNYL